MELNKLRFLAKYPFLKETREYVTSLNIPFGDMLKHPIYSAALELGVERVKDCVGKRFKPRLAEGGLELLILSYPMARMLAHSVGGMTASRYAEGEAETAYRLMLEESDGVIAEISEDLGVRFEEGLMLFIQYTRLSASLGRRNPKWKLSNRVVDRGFVEVEVDEFRVLLGEAVKSRVLEPVDLRKVPEEVKRQAGNLRTQFTGVVTTMRIEQLEDGALPPCIKGVVAALEAGVASHNGMFILATFLSNLGLRKEDILSVFAGSPKFDEEKTLYQLEFLTGEKSTTEYTCPTCATIKSQGLCKADCPVKHPLQYYRRHAKRKPKVIKKEGE